jgi:predicted transcriptional regulator
MPELTVTLSNAAHQTLTQLAETSGETMQMVLDKAIENYRRYVFLIQANEAFAALKQNEELWHDELAREDYGIRRWLMEQASSRFAWALWGYGTEIE